MNILQITQEQIKDFSKELKEFADRFYLEGPGAVGSNLDKGLFKKVLLKTVHVL